MIGSKMIVTHSDQQIVHGASRLETKHSIFLAGPTPRSKEVESWRPFALDILRDLEYDGFVWVPELYNRDATWDYMHQVEWEKWGLDEAVSIVFWVPRDIDTLPAFTTNVEFGRYVDCGRAIYGRPDGSHKNDYLDWLYKDATGRSHFTDLRELLKAAIEMGR